MPIISDLLKYYMNCINTEDVTIQSNIDNLKLHIYKIEKALCEKNEYICGN